MILILMIVIAVLLISLLFYDKYENYSSEAPKDLLKDVFSGKVKIKDAVHRIVKYMSPGTEGIMYTDYLNISSDDAPREHKYDDGDYDKTKQRRAIGQIRYE